MKYGVQAGWLTDNIWIGKVNKVGNAFLEKEEATDMVLAAVAQYVMRNFDGGLAATFPRLGLNLEVKVTPMVNGQPKVSRNEKP